MSARWEQPHGYLQLVDGPTLLARVWPTADGRWRGRMYRLSEGQVREHDVLGRLSSEAVWRVGLLVDTWTRQGLNIGVPLRAVDRPPTAAARWVYGP